MISEEIARQLRLSGIVPSAPSFDSPRVREAREYAHKVFGNAAKGDSWLLRPSIRLDGARPIDYVETHDDTNPVYAALDAIAHGFPL